jgi:antitoxin component YwqK of YwqJK toxin-antitoxin module
MESRETLNFLRPKVGPLFWEYEWMRVLLRDRIALFGLIAAFVLVQTWAAGDVLAQETAKERVTVKPYTGPPIFLDEVEQVAEPTIIRRVTDTSEKFKDGKVRIERQIAEFSDNHIEADGSYKEYYPNGQLFVEGQYKRGRQHGEWTYYFDSGKLNRKATFKEGKPDGPRDVFRADGTLSAKRGFADGLRDGDWITYDATGKNPTAEEHYDKGKATGVWKYWHPNGKQSRQISIKDGKRHGVTTEWDDKGEKRFEGNFVEDKPHGTSTRWFPDGRKIVQEYDNGKLIKQSS